MKRLWGTMVRKVGCGLLACALVGGIWSWLSADRPSAGAPVRELLRGELDLRDGVLFARGEVDAFEGKLVEPFSVGRPKLVIEIAGGKAHGWSRGWYENGQLEVEEWFVDGVSQGTRRRWHTNGSLKSEAEVRDGKVVGRFREWHENGQVAVEMTLVEGKADGVAEAWYASGAPKSRVRFEGGKQEEREFWDDAGVGDVRVSVGVR